VIYDPMLDAWHEGSPMPGPRTGLGVAGAGGRVYAIGGQDLNGTVSVVEAYDPVTDTWTSKAPMPTPRARFGLGVINGIVYAVGGLD
jgi:hypothetical protein